MRPWCRPPPAARHAPHARVTLSLARQCQLLSKCTPPYRRLSPYAVHKSLSNSSGLAAPQQEDRAAAVPWSGPVVSPQGFCGMPGITTPAALKAYWYRHCRPRIDTLYRACTACGPEVQLLLLLDELVGELKNVQAKCRHCAGRHSSEAWRSAGEEVTHACDKYEAYLYRSSAIFNKVRLVGAMLQQQELQRQEGQPQEESRGGQTKEPHLSSLPLHRDQVGPVYLEPARLTPTTVAGLPSPSVLLQLSELLLVPFQRCSVQVEFGLSHLGLLVGGGIASEAAESQEWQEASQLAQEERSAALAIRTALGPGPKAATLLCLEDVDWGRTGAQEARRSGVDAAQTNLGLEPNREGCEGQISAGEGTASSGSASGSAPSLLHPWEMDPLMHPLLQRAADLGLPAGHILLERASLQHLLRHHPLPALRRAVYEGGVVPRKRDLLLLRAELASIRGLLAQARGEKSAAHSALSNLSLDQPMAMVSFLEACATAARPAAEEQLRQMTKALATVPEVGALSSREVEKQAGEEEGPAPVMGTGLLVDEADASVLPWDLAYAQQRMLQESCPLVATKELQPIMHLKDILQGVSDLLQASMGVCLELQHTAPYRSTSDQAAEADSPAPSLTLTQRMEQESRLAELSSVDDGGVGRVPGVVSLPPSLDRDCELWSASVLKLLVTVPETGASGVLYIDPGGGYGARQLHFACHTRGQQQQQPVAGRPQRSQDSCGQPAVSLGLMWSWPGGVAEGLQSLWELMHEIGHGLHLILSSNSSSSSCGWPGDSGICGAARSETSVVNNTRGDGDLKPPVAASGMARSVSEAEQVGGIAGMGIQPQPQIGTSSSSSSSSMNSSESSSTQRWAFKHFGGLHLPLDLLEVPSMLMEKMIMSPRSLQVILLGRSCQEGSDAADACSEGAERRRQEGQVAPGPKAAQQTAISWMSTCQLAQHYQASHYGALDFQEQVLVAMADHLMNLFGPSSCGDSGALVWESVWEIFSPLATDSTQAIYSSDSAASITSLKQLSVAPVAAHHQGTYCAYIVAFVIASALWDAHYDEDPLDPQAGRLVRGLLYEQGPASLYNGKSVLQHLLPVWPEGLDKTRVSKGLGTLPMAGELIEEPVGQPEVIGADDAQFDVSSAWDVEPGPLFSYHQLQGWLWKG